MSTNTPPNLSRDAIERAFFNHDTKGAETSTEKWLKRKSEWRSFLSYLEKSQDQPKTQPESIAYHEASKENPKPSPQVGMGVGLPQDASIPTPETRVTGPGFIPTWLGATQPASDQDWKSRAESAEAQLASLKSHLVTTELERDRLQSWKDQMLTVESWWRKVDEFIRNHPKAPIGQNVSDVALQWLRAYMEEKDKQ